MTNVAIRVQGLSKQYRIGKCERYKTLRDTLTDTVSAPFRRVRSMRPHAGNEVTESPIDLIWALRDVSFEVPQGAVLGVIGRNGAGKSTLLKVLSRITEPTEGRVEIHGRVGSLLEVGTGFHPELTGRDNIFLNGAILGMKKAEIARKFDEIVAFAEVEKFIDTPVKHYSSGMYMRLAFAVAAHLEPEILIVDEVLAVGDLNFQKKCLGKMGDVASGGRTVVFVSHQMGQVRRLCHAGVWLQDGRVRAHGDITTVTNEYEASVSHRGSHVRPANGNGKARFLRWEIVEETRHAGSHTLTRNEPFRIAFSLQVDRHLVSTFHGIALLSSEGQVIWGHGTHNLEFAVGMHKIVYTIATLPLRPGAYQWLVSLHDQSGVVDVWESLPHLMIATRSTNRALDYWAGLLNPHFEVSVLSDGPISSLTGLRGAIQPQATRI